MVVAAKVEGDGGSGGYGSMGVAWHNWGLGGRMVAVGDGGDSGDD